MRVALMASAAGIAVLVSGCVVVDATATVAGAAVSVTATTIEVGAKVVGAAADAAVSDSSDDPRDEDGVEDKETAPAE
jgi:hypothetical protein